MLGVIRFALAICVSIYHLVATIPNLGPLSVNFFYVISGFLITLVLHETYAFSFKPFAMNRFLRLYPSYYFLCIFTVFVTIVFSDFQNFYQDWDKSFEWTDAIANLFLVPWIILSPHGLPINLAELCNFNQATSFFILIPTTWSVAIEIVCYGLLWLYLGRNTKAALITIAIALVAQIFVVFLRLDQKLNYYPITAAILPFALGALAYHLTKIYKIPTLSNGYALLITAVILLCFYTNWAYSPPSRHFFYKPSYYFNTLIAFICVIIINKTRTSGFLGRVDRWLGDLAYPLFLGHMICGFLAWELLGAPESKYNWEVFFIGTAINLVLSTLVVIFIDHPLVKWRGRIRSMSNEDAELTLKPRKVAA